MDAIITWENPTPTTVFVEMKYNASLGAKVSNHIGANGYASDQLARNARVERAFVGRLEA